MKKIIFNFQFPIFKKGPAQYRKHKLSGSGFVILFAVTISSILLALALGVGNIALKEIKFSTSAKDTNEAFFAADAGVESALFQDKDGDICEPAPCSFSFTFPDPVVPGQSCAKIIVDKTASPATTVIVSKGYNIGNALCDSDNPDRIERELKVTYGDSSSPADYNLTVSLGGTGDGTVTSNPAGINCGSTCEASYSDDTEVTLTAAPEAGSSFSGWSGDCSGSGTCDLTMNADQSATATFNAVSSQITFVGANSRAASTIPIPAHQSGDLIVIFAYRDGSSSPPPIPSPWSPIASSGGSGNSSSLAYRIAPGPPGGAGTTRSGTWSVSGLVVHVYRGQHLTDPIGANGSTGGAPPPSSAGTTVTYPSLSLDNADGTSWVAGFAGHRSTNTNLQNAPSGMINHTSVVGGIGSAEMVGHDSDGGVSSWGSTNVSVGGSPNGWRARTLEIISR